MKTRPTGESRRGISPRCGELMMEMLVLFNEFEAGETLLLMTRAGLSLLQIVTLHTLHTRGPHSLSAIAEHLRLSRPSVTALIDHLVRDGLVVRSEDTVDRRRKKVEISPAGTELLKQLSRTKAEECMNVLRKLSPGAQLGVERIMMMIVEELGSA